VNKNRRITIRLLMLGLVATASGCAQEAVQWHDPSQHKVQFVTVEEGVQLEVLDWGGSGRRSCCWRDADSRHMFSTVSPKNLPTRITFTESLDAVSGPPVNPERVIRRPSWRHCANCGSVRIPTGLLAHNLDCAHFARDNLIKGGLMLEPQQSRHTQST